MDVETVRALLERRVSEGGGYRQWAADNGCAFGFTNRVAKGHAEPSDVILKALGLERVVSYRPVQAAPKGRKTSKGARNGRASAQ